MKFNRWELRRIKQALYSAIDNEYAFIDAHQTELKSVKGDIISVAPKEHKQVIDKTKRTIVSWQKILKKILFKERATR